ncbi:tetratricopeptide repeat protein [Amycolatopsis sp. NPDC003861]
MRIEFDPCLQRRHEEAVISPSVTSNPNPRDPREARSPADLIAQMKEFRERCGVTIRDLAQRTGLPRATVHDALKPDRKNLKDDVAAAIVAELYKDTGFQDAWLQQWRYLHGLQDAENTVVVEPALPERLPRFTGRGNEVSHMVERLHPDDGDPPRLIALTGLAGMGKTALAIHLAHEMSHRRAFDKKLFVNLRGVDPDPSLRPVAPGAVLDQILRMVGVRADKIPLDLDGKTTLFRRMCQNHRLLIVLDNAKNAAQVGPLVAHGPGCLTVITSRNRLSELAETIRLDIGGLERADTLRLLRSVQPLADADPATLRQIAGLLHDVPMSLVSVLFHAESHADWTAEEHLERLRTLFPNAAAAGDDAGSVTGPGEIEASIVAPLTLSYQSLGATAQTLICLLGHHPGHDLDDETAAALTGQPVDSTRAALAELSEAYFLNSLVPGRHEPHDLVRGFAVLRAIDDVSPTARRQAMQRVVAHYLQAAAAATSSASGEHAGAGDTIDPRYGTGWLRAELANIIRLVRSAAVTEGLHCAAHQLAAAVVPTLVQQARYRDIATLLSAAQPAYVGCAHTADHAQSLNQLGQAHRQLGQTDLAITLHQQALSHYTATRDALGHIATLNKLGLAHRAQGHVHEAQNHHSRAADMAVKLGSDRDALISFGNLGVTHDLLGQLNQALACYHRVLDLAAETDDPRAMAKARSDIGIIYVRRNHVTEGIDQYRAALAILADYPDQLAETILLENLGIAHTKAGDPVTGLRYLSQALTMREESGHVRGESHTHHDLGMTCLALGEPERALDHMRRAHELASSIGSNLELALAENGLAEIAYATGDFPQAAARFECALDHARAIRCLDEQARAHFGLARIPDRAPAAVDADRKAGENLIAVMQVPEPPVPRVGM